MAASLLAAAAPTLAAFNQPPSATLLNQCLAGALWGGVAVVSPPGRLARGLGPLLAALGVVAAGVAVSGGLGGLPLSLALLALGLLAGTALMVITDVVEADETFCLGSRKGQPRVVLLASVEVVRRARAVART